MSSTFSMHCNCKQILMRFSVQAITVYLRHNFVWLVVVLVCFISISFLLFCFDLFWFDLIWFDLIWFDLICCVLFCVLKWRLKNVHIFCQIGLLWRKEEQSRWICRLTIFLAMECGHSLINHILILITKSAIVKGHWSHFVYFCDYWFAFILYPIY